MNIDSNNVFCKVCGQHIPYEYDGRILLIIPCICSKPTEVQPCSVRPTLAVIREKGFGWCVMGGTIWLICTKCGHEREWLDCKKEENFDCSECREGFAMIPSEIIDKYSPAKQVKVACVKVDIDFAITGMVNAAEKMDEFNKNVQRLVRDLK